MSRWTKINAAQLNREREVMAALRVSRWVNIFWLQNPLARWEALERMEKRGEVSVKIMGYPMYRVTIHRPKSALVQCSHRRCTGHSCGGAHNHPHARADACDSPCFPGDHRCVAISKRKAGKA
jgi:hypothetical protein